MFSNQRICWNLLSLLSKKSKQTVNQIYSIIDHLFFLHIFRVDPAKDKTDSAPKPTPAEVKTNGEYYKARGVH